MLLKVILLLHMKGIFIYNLYSIKAFFDRTDIKYNQYDIKAIFKRIDTNKDGKICFNDLKFLFDISSEIIRA